MLYIKVDSLSSNERFGANLLHNIAIIVLCHFSKYGCIINFNNRYNDNQFVIAIKEYIKDYNSSIVCTDTKFVFEIIGKKIINSPYDLFLYVINTINQDIFSYYEKYIKNDVLFYFKKEYTLPKKINFDNLFIHLRTDDLNNENSFDYDASYLKNFFQNINYDNFISIKSEFIKYFIKNKEYFEKNSPNEKFLKININLYHNWMSQSIINEKKIINIINELHYNDDNITTISSNKGNYNLKYKNISTSEELDFFILSSCKKYILSRSTYALCSIFFNYYIQEIWIPNSGITYSCGLNSKFDKNKNFKYFN